MHNILAGAVPVAFTSLDYVQFILAVIMVGLLCVYILQGVRSYFKNQSAYGFMDCSRKLLAAGQYSAAVDVMSLAVDRNPCFDYAYIYALAKFHNREFEDALIVTDIGMKLRHFELTHQLRNRIYICLGRYDDAVRDAKDAIWRGPCRSLISRRAGATRCYLQDNVTTMAECHRWLAVALYTSGHAATDTVTASDAFNAASNNAPNAIHSLYSSCHRWGIITLINPEPATLDTWGDIARYLAAELDKARAESAQSPLLGATRAHMPADEYLAPIICDKARILSIAAFLVGEITAADLLAAATKHRASPETAHLDPTLRAEPECDAHYFIAVLAGRSGCLSYNRPAQMPLSPLQKEEEIRSHLRAAVATGAFRLMSYHLAKADLARYERRRAGSATAASTSTTTTTAPVMPIHVSSATPSGRLR